MQSFRKERIVLHTELCRKLFLNIRTVKWTKWYSILEGNISWFADGFVYCSTNSEEHSTFWEGYVYSICWTRSSPPAIGHEVSLLCTI